MGVHDPIWRTWAYIFQIGLCWKKPPKEWQIVLRFGGEAEQKWMIRLIFRLEGIRCRPKSNWRISAVVISVSKQCTCFFSVEKPIDLTSNHPSNVVCISKLWGQFRSLYQSRSHRQCSCYLVELDLQGRNIERTQKHGKNLTWPMAKRL